MLLIAANIGLLIVLITTSAQASGQQCSVFGGDGYESCPTNQVCAADESSQLYRCLPLLRAGEGCVASAQCSGGGDTDLACIFDKRTQSKGCFCSDNTKKLNKRTGTCVPRDYCEQQKDCPIGLTCDTSILKCFNPSKPRTVKRQTIITTSRETRVSTSRSRSPWSWIAPTVISLVVVICLIIACVYYRDSCCGNDVIVHDTVTYGPGITSYGVATPSVYVHSQPVVQHHVGFGMGVSTYPAVGYPIGGDVYNVTNHHVTETMVVNDTMDYGGGGGYSTYPANTEVYNDGQYGGGGVETYAADSDMYVPDY